MRQLLAEDGIPCAPGTVHRIMAEQGLVARRRRARFDPGGGTAEIDPPARQNPRRYFGSVTLNPPSLASQVSEISREVVANLQGTYGTEAWISLEIQAVVPDGIPENRRRAVIEGSEALKFDQSDFADE